MVADPARSRMLAYLLAGEFASAGELAKAASVTPATASGHLAKLVEARFSSARRAGGIAISGSPMRRWRMPWRRWRWWPSAISTTRPGRIPNANASAMPAVATGTWPGA